MRAVLLALAPALALAGTGPAEAHPHVWVTTRTEVVFDRDRRATGFRHTWTFDEAYSAYSVQGLDSRRDGRPDADKLAELARTNVESLADWNWFTAAKLNGARAAFLPPTEQALSYEAGRLTLRFTLPLKAPARVKVLTLQVDDPSFFVAFNLAPGAEAVRLADAPAGCALDVHRPAKAAEEGVQILADAVANALAGGADAASVGEDFTARALVACP